MTRESEAALLDFCARQWNDFRSEAWLAAPHPNRDEFVAVILFLSSVEWYGHRQALREIARSLAPDQVGRLGELARETGFDASRFSTLLRRLLRHESVVRPS